MHNIIIIISYWHSIYRHVTLYLMLIEFDP